MLSKQKIFHKPLADSSTLIYTAFYTEYNTFENLWRVWHVDDNLELKWHACIT